MKKIIKFWFAAMIAVMVGILPSCTKEYLDDVPELPDLPRVTNLNYTIDGFDIVLSWNLPSTSLSVSGITVARINDNGQAVQTWDLPAGTTTFNISGAPMGEENGYTVKVKYDDGKYSSMGETIYATLPAVDLSPVTNLKADVNRRTVTLTWTLPQNSNITGVRIYRSDNPESVTAINEAITSFEMKSQPMDETLTFNVEAVYADNYFSAPARVDAIVPYVETKAGFLLLANSITDLPDDDEIAAATWFAQQPNTTFVSVDQLASLDPEEVSVLWIIVDRIGLEPGWQNLPAPLSSQATIDALKAYSAAGGSLYLSNMATQLTAPIGIVPMDMAPNIFSSGNGGEGSDVWTINPHLGWDFQGSDIYYDRAEHVIFEGIVMEDPNGYGYGSVPMIGPGQREDHNCMWDCNVFGPGNQSDVIRNFEVTTNSMVFATWGHVRDHCVAGLVEFMANMDHGRCIAMGFAAYEWNQNSGPNPYQGNIERLTSNILNYLK